MSLNFEQYIKTGKLHDIIHSINTMSDSNKTDQVGVMEQGKTAQASGSRGGLLVRDSYVMSTVSRPN